MPMHHLAANAPDFFCVVNRILAVTMSTRHTERLAGWTKDIVEYRLHRYFYERTGG